MKLLFQQMRLPLIAVLLVVILPGHRPPQAPPEVSLKADEPPGPGGREEERGRGDREPREDAYVKEL